MPLIGQEFVIRTRTVRNLHRNCRLGKVATDDLRLRGAGESLKVFARRNRAAIMTWYESEYPGRTVRMVASKLFRR